MAYDSISYRREIDSYSLDIGDGNDHGHGMVFGLIHPPSIFTLFASPVEVLRRRRRLSLRMSFVFLYSWFNSSSSRDLFHQHVVSLYSWFDSSSSRDCFIDVLVFESYSLDTVRGGLGLFGLLQSAVHLHSFRFAGGSLTAGDRPHFSENVVCISLFLVWFHHLREIGLSRCISSFNRFDFIIDERLI